MRFKDLDAKVRGWRSVDIWQGPIDKKIWVCVADTHYGSGDTVRAALDMAFIEAKRRQDRG